MSVEQARSLVPRENRAGACTRLTCALMLGAASWLAAGASAQEGGDTEPVPELSVATRVDKTAVWVGDHFHYQITVDHAPTIQFVLENVNNRDAINLDPLSVVDATSSTTQLANGNQRLVVDLTLANFTTGVTEIQIPQLSLFYFRRDGAAVGPVSSEGTAAESLSVEGPVIGVRSTLLPRASDLRDPVTVTGWPRNRWVVSALGWFALMVLVLGVGWEGARLIRHRNESKEPDPRSAMAAIQRRWAQSVPGDFTDAGVATEFCGSSYRDLKEYLGYLLETHTEGLTSDEMGEEMRRRAAGSDLTERVVKVLGICEVARYGRSTNEPIGDIATGIAHDMREIFESGSRLKS